MPMPVPPEPDAVPYQIAIANEQSTLSLDETLWRAATVAVLKSENITTASISIALIDDEAMHELNRRHLEHDYPTDVLSFLLDSDPDGSRIEGEILISTDTAIRQATEFGGWRPEDEALLYLIHGLLHLCGYDDHTDEDRSTMRDRERTLLAQWNLQPRYEAS